MYFPLHILGDQDPSLRNSAYPGPSAEAQVVLASSRRFMFFCILAEGILQSRSRGVLIKLWDLVFTVKWGRSHMKSPLLVDKFRAKCRYCQGAM